jgi:hypothetical protein
MRYFRKGKKLDTTQFSPTYWKPYRIHFEGIFLVLNFQDVQLRMSKSPVPIHWQGHNTRVSIGLIIFRMVGVTKLKILAFMKEDVWMLFYSISTFTSSKLLAFWEAYLKA